MLHNRSVEMAKKYNVNLTVRSSLNKNEGTVVKEVNKVEKMIVRGVARDNDVARISICNIEDKPGMAFKVFSLLAKNKINVDIILQSIGREGMKDISFHFPSSLMTMGPLWIRMFRSAVSKGRVFFSSKIYFCSLERQVNTSPLI